MLIPVTVLYAVAVLALALAIYPLIVSFKSNIDVDAINAQLIKLIQAGNIERARKLCAAAPGAAYLQIAARMLANDPAERGIESAGRAEREFRRAFDEVVARQKLPLMLSGAGAVIALSALLLSLLNGALGTPALVGGGALVVSIVGVMAVLRTRSAIPPAAKELSAALRKSAGP